MGHSEETKGDVLAHLYGVISRHTGYAIDELDPGFELESDLGIDSIKQAEILTEALSNYGLAVDESFQLPSGLSIEDLAGALANKINAEDGVLKGESMHAEVLRDLKALHDEGVITDADFEAQKATVLGKMTGGQAPPPAAPKLSQPPSPFDGLIWAVLGPTMLWGMLWLAMRSFFPKLYDVGVDKIDQSMGICTVMIIGALAAARVVRNTNHR